MLEVRPYGVLSQGLEGTEMMVRSVRFVIVIHGLESWVMHRLAGQL